MTEREVQYIIDRTWREAMETVARKANEIADGMSEAVPGPVALRAFGFVVVQADRSTGQDGGSA